MHSPTYVFDSNILESPFKTFYLIQAERGLSNHLPESSYFTDKVPKVSVLIANPALKVTPLGIRIPWRFPSLIRQAQGFLSFWTE